MKWIQFCFINFLVACIMTTFIISFYARITMDNKYQLKNTYTTFYVAIETLEEERIIKEKVNRFIENNPSCFISIKGEVPIERVYDGRKGDTHNSLNKVDEWAGEYTVSELSEDKLKGFMQIFRNANVSNYTKYEKEQRVIDNIKKFFDKTINLYQGIGVIFVCYCYFNIMKYAVKNEKKRIKIFFLLGGTKKQLRKQIFTRTIIMRAFVIGVGSLFSFGILQKIVVNQLNGKCVILAMGITLFITEIILQLVGYKQIKFYIRGGINK